MIAVLNNISATKFSLNGIPYFKNFIPVVHGDRVRILCTYDARIELLPLSAANEITVNGNNYVTIAELQSALLPILFTRSSLTGIEINGNITSINQAGDIITFTLDDNSEYQLDLSSITTNQNLISNHIADQDNPHGITKASLGLGNVDNTPDIDKPISTQQLIALNNKVDKSAVLINLNSAGDKTGLTVFGVKAGINGGGFFIGEATVSNPINDSQINFILQL